ncbi:MAG: hypothetical protein M1833_001175 [Piccolia ochrophora]|nr:MAG: hypothetical protein M1833_001175 [Piccolia ochrophora]
MLFSHTRRALLPRRHLVALQDTIIVAGRPIHQRTEAKGANTSAGAQSAPHKEDTGSSLLEDLFPGETRWQAKNFEEDDIDIPRIVLPFTNNNLPPDAKTGGRARRDSQRNSGSSRRGPDLTAHLQLYSTASEIDEQRHLPEAKADQYRSSRDLQVEQIAVLRFYNASKSLAESDFQRIMPIGRHIEGWKTEESIFEVVSERDPQTLSAVAAYYVVFPSTSAAEAYGDRVGRLHALAKAYTPKSIESPLIPPPGYMLEGEDVHALLQSYTLFAPSQELHMTLMRSPILSSVRDRVWKSKQTRMTSRRRLPPCRVLVQVEGTRPTAKELHGMMAKCGLGDDLSPWQPHTGQVPAAGYDSAVEHHDHDWLPGLKPDADRTSSRATLEQVKGQVVEFSREVEALRFVRAWHRRPLVVDEKDPTDSHLTRRVTAELLPQ